MFLGDTLDTDSIGADYSAGVLTLTIPVHEQAKPRTIQITGHEDHKQVTASAGTSPECRTRLPHAALRQARPHRPATLDLQPPYRKASASSAAGGRQNQEGRRPT